jgi:hypothetical protein
MMKRALLVFVILFSSAAWAQFTTVTGTVIDPNGIPYAGGTITAQLVITGTTPTLNGGSFSMTGAAGLNPAGKFTMRLADSNVMVPNLQWSFTVCSGTGTIQPAGGTGPQCFTPAPITITSGSQDISAQLQAAALALSNGGGGLPPSIPFLATNGSAAPIPAPLPAGSVVAGNSLNLAAAQLKPVIDALDQGVTTSGDQATNLTNAWNAMGAHQQELWRSGTFSIGSSVSPNSSGAYQIGGLGGTGYYGSGTTFNQSGGGAYTVFNLDRQRDSTIGNFLLNMNGAAGSIGLLLSQLSGTSGQISSHNVIHDITINGVGGAGSVGFQVVAPSGDSGSNNEAHIFWHNSILGGTGGTGFEVFPGSSNARSIGYYESEVNSTDTGYQLGAGSWHVLGGLTEAHLTALDVKGSAGGFYGFVHDESSKQAVMFDPYSGGSGGIYLFMGNRYEVDSPDLTKYQWDFGSCTEYCITIGNYFNHNANITKMVNTGGLGRLISIGDHLPNTTLANLPDLRIANSADVIGTSNIYSSDFVGVERTANNQAGDGDALNGLWIGPTLSNSPSNWFQSPGLVLAAGYLDSGSALHMVPFRFKALLTGVSGTSAATFKLLPPTDPVTGTTYAGPLNVDFQTNGNNFLMKHAQVSDLASTGLISSSVPATIATSGTAYTSTVARVAASVASTPIYGMGTVHINTSVASTSLTLNINIGDTVVVFLNTSSATPPTITDNGSSSNTYAQVGSMMTLNGNGWAFVCTSAAHVATTISVNETTYSMAGATFINVSAIGAVHTNTGTTSSTASDSVTTTANYSLVISGFQGTTTSFLPISGNLIAFAPPTPFVAETLVVQTVPSSGTVATNSGTLSGSVPWEDVTIELKPTPTPVFTTTIASGTAALNTVAIGSGACDTVVTVAATGVATTDNISADFNADPTGTTGYMPSVSGMLTIIKYPTANNVNFKVCNNTSGSITPGAVTLNWRVVR